MGLFTQRKKESCVLLFKEIVMDTQEPGVIIAWLKTLPSAFFTFALKVVLVILIFFVGRKLIRFLIKRIRVILDRSKLDKTLSVMLAHVIHTAMYIVLVLTMLGALGYQATSVAAVLASAGLSVGLAFQGTLSNLAGGVLLMVAKPFGIGDWISDGGKDADVTFEGEVVNIGLAYTTIETIDGRSLVVPNSILSSDKVANYTRKGKRRIIADCAISYGDDLRKAYEVIEQVIRSFPQVMQDEPIEVFVNKLGDNGVELQGWCWVPSSNYVAVKHAILGRIKTELEAAGMHIPFPQVDVHMGDPAPHFPGDGE